MNPLYVGVTGPTTAEEVSSILDSFRKAGYSMETRHVPMLGFLISHKTLNGQQTENKRYPSFTGLRKLLEAANSRLFPTVHYNSREQTTLAEQLNKVFDGLYQDGLCRAVQLNIVWPEIEQIRLIKSQMPELKIIFQANNGVMDEKTPKEIAVGIERYGSCIDYVLIDASGGRGLEFDTKLSARIYEELRQRIPHDIVGIAGGLNGSNVKDKAGALAMKLGSTDFCIDAEGGLRDKLGPEYGNDVLSASKVRRYLTSAYRVLP